jgi:hypothetical protein
LRVVEHLLHAALVRFGYVQHETLPLDTALLEHLRDALSALLAGRRAGDACTHGPELQGDRLADATACAGDECQFSLQ